jgi:Ca2+-binding EF-hand superfamily protein
VVLWPQEFVLALVAFSPNATPEDRFRLLFTVFDTDCDGIISQTDLIRMLTKLLSSGSFT